MKWSLIRFLQSTGCSISDLRAPTSDMHLNPNISDLKLTPRIVEQIHEVIYATLSSVSAKRKQRDYVAVCCVLHLLTRKEEAVLETVVSYSALRDTYCNTLVTLYDQEHFPFEIEKAIIELCGNNLIKELTECGHVWSEEALELMKDKHPGAYERWGSKYRLSPDEVLQYVHQVTEHGCITVDELSTKVPSALVAKLIREGYLAYKCTYLVLSDQGKMRVENLEQSKTC